MEIVSFLAAHRGNRSPLAPVSEAGARQLLRGVLYFQPIYCSVEKGAYRCSSSQIWDFGGTGLFNKPALSKHCQRSDLMPFSAYHTKR